MPNIEDVISLKVYNGTPTEVEIEIKTRIGAFTYSEDSIRKIARELDQDPLFTLLSIANEISINNLIGGTRPYQELIEK